MSKEKWLQARDPKKESSKIGYDERAFYVAKKLFLESELYEDLNEANSLSNKTQGENPQQQRRKRYGLTLDHRKNFIN